MSTSSASIVEIVLAIILPPAGVAVHSGISKQFWICVVLTLLGFIPGLIYALYVIL